MVKTRKLRMDRSALGNQGQVVLLYKRLYGNGDRGSSFFSRNRKIERSIIVAKAQETHNQRSGSVVMRSDDPAE
jgi:hypothetical protein